MNKLFIFILLTLFPFTIWAEEWTDPTTNVIYTYDPAGTTASVKASSGGIGCPDAKGDIVIADEIEVDGRRYRVTSIGTYAFSNNTAITSIYVPESVTSIGQGAFAGCKNLTTIRLSKNITRMESYLFANCNELTTIEIPEGVTYIGPYAFSYCWSLTELHIPANVTSISDEAFWLTYELQHITVAADNPVYDSRQDCNAIIVTKENKIFKACDNTTIPPDIVCIGRYSFSQYKNSSDLILPDGLTTIEENAFTGQGPRSIFIPASVTSISRAAFSSCGLQAVTIDPACPITNLAAFSFSGCLNLTTVFLPAGLTLIDRGAFYDCKNLNEIHFLSEKPAKIYSEAFVGINEKCIAYVPVGSVVKYRNVLGMYIAAFAEDSETATITVDDTLCTHTTLLPLDFSNVEGLSAYIIESFDQERGLLLAKKVTKVPARTGLLLSAEAPGDFLVSVDWEAEPIGDNMLKDVLKDRTNLGYKNLFILIQGSHGIGFYPWSGGILSAGKAYLQIPEQMLNDAELKELGILFEDGTTGLQTQRWMENGKDETYDLSGRRVKASTSRHGLYIRKGKKMVIH